VRHAVELRVRGILKPVLEVNASQKDKDFIAAINWKQAESCLSQGKAAAVPARYAHNLMGEDGIARTEWGSGVKMLTPAACPGAVAIGRRRARGAALSGGPATRREI
jgi:hypothetical protein